jgi:hypothetical protein
LGDPNPHHRVVCIDRLHFDDKGLIRSVEMTFTGVGPRLLK